MSKIHLLSESSVKWLKQQARILQKEKSIKFSQALNEIALSQGFPCWKDLTDTFKFESGSPHWIMHFKNDFSLLEPYEIQATAIQKGLLDAQGIDLESSDLASASILTDDLYYRRVNEALNAAREQVAKNNGFPSWVKLQEKFIKQIVIEKYSLEQKIGAVARSVGIDPKKMKNTIHVAIEIDNDEVMRLKSEDWERAGLVEDHNFSNWISKNDGFFGESFCIFFRFLSADTKSFSVVEKHLAKVSSKLDLFFPIFSNAIWINGKIDKSIFQSIKDDHLDHFPDVDLNSIEYPLAEVPTEIWKGGY